MIMAKKQKWNAGDIFVVPLLDKAYAIGQVVCITKKAMNSAVCIFFDYRIYDSKISSADISQLFSANVVAVQFCTMDLLNSGGWQVVSNLEPFNVREYLNIEEYEQKSFIGVPVLGSGVLQALMNAYYALSPWDCFFDPNLFDTLLVSTCSRPDNVIFKNTSVLQAGS